MFKKLIVSLGFLLLLNSALSAGNRSEWSQHTASSSTKVMVGKQIYTNNLDVYSSSANYIPRAIVNGITGEITAREFIFSDITVWEQTTAEDWGAGSGINIDTTTYSGSVAINFIGDSYHSYGAWNIGTNKKIWQEIAMTDSGNMQIASGYISGVYKSIDYGVTWTLKTAALDFMGLDMSSNGEIQVAAGIGTYIYKSDDYGESWDTTVGTIDQWRDIVMSEDGSVILASAESGVFLSTDSGATWNEKLDDAVRTFQDVAISSNGRVMSVACTVSASAAGYIYVSTNTGTTWTNTSAAKTWRSVAMSDGGDIITAHNSGDNNIYVSTNTGETWSNKGGFGNISTIYMTDDGSRQIAVSNNGPVFISSNSGSNWTDYGFGEYLDGCAISQNGNYITVGSGDPYGDYIYTLASTSSSYTTQSMTDANWGSWGMFEVDSTVPNSSTITYQMITSTYLAGLDTGVPFAVIDETLIDSVVGPYAKVLVSMTRETIADPLVGAIRVFYDAYLPSHLAVREDVAVSTQALQANIESNDTDISNLWVSTGTNQADIATNTSNIGDNYTDILAVKESTHTHVAGTNISITGTSEQTISVVNLTTGNVSGSWPATDLQAGSLPSTVIASSIAVNAVELPSIKATGTRDATTFLRGDGTFNTPAGGGASAMVIKDESSYVMETGTINWVGAGVAVTDGGDGVTIVTIDGLSQGISTGTAISAYLSTPQLISTDTITQIMFDSEEYDSNNEFTSSSFTVQSAGKYLVFVSACTDEGYIRYINIKKNDISMFALEENIEPQTQSGILDCVEGDIISVWLVGNPSTDVYLLTGSSNTYMTIYQLSTGLGGVSGSGDMLKSTYDTGDNGVVDNSEALNGNAYAHFVNTTTAQDIAGNKTILGNTSLRYTTLVDTNGVIIATLKNYLNASQNLVYGNANAITTGTENFISGKQAGTGLTTGRGNTFGGTYAGAGIIDGDSNTAYGNRSGEGIGSGSVTQNTSMGTLAGYQKYGGQSSFFGYSAGRFQQDGATRLSTATNSIFIGANVKSSTNTSTNEIVIGANAIGNGDNTVTIGDNNITDTYLKGNVHASTGTFTGMLNVSSITATGGITTTGALTVGSYDTEMPATKISAGTLDSDVIASSIAVNAVPNESIVSVSASKVLTGSLGSSVIASSIAVNSVQNESIVAVAGSKVTELPAANVQAGSLPVDVISSSIAVNAVENSAIAGTGTRDATTFYRGDGTFATPSGSGDMVEANINTYEAIVNTSTAQDIGGVKTFTENIIIRNEGGIIITTMTATAVPFGINVSTYLDRVEFTEYAEGTTFYFMNNADNSDVTIETKGLVKGGTLSGDGNAITAITAANISAGNLGAAVIASSIAVNSVQNESIVAVDADKISSGNLGSGVVAQNIADSSYSMRITTNSWSVPFIIGSTQTWITNYSTKMVSGKLDYATTITSVTFSIRGGTSASVDLYIRDADTWSSVVGSAVLTATKAITVEGFTGGTLDNVSLTAGQVIVAVFHVFDGFVTDVIIDIEVTQ